MPDQIPRFASQGELVPLDAALKDTVHKFLPAALDAVTQDGRIYGAPIYQTVTTTIYNKWLLAEYGSQAPRHLGRDQGGRTQTAQQGHRPARLLRLGRRLAEPQLLSPAVAGGRPRLFRGRHTGRLQQCAGSRGAHLPHRPLPTGRDSRIGDAERQSGRRAGARPAAGRFGVLGGPRRRRPGRQGLG